MSEKQFHSRIPSEFMRDIYLSPSVFSDPQNPAHGQYVNMELKYDLYRSVVNQISATEFSMFSSGHEMQITQIKPCVAVIPYIGLMQSIKKLRGRRPMNKDGSEPIQIACQDWVVELRKAGQLVQRSLYQVKVTQTDTDVFTSLIYTSRIGAILKDLLMN